MEKNAITQPHILVLPTEVLCFIFWLACGPSPSPFRKGAENPLAYTEAQISHVCRCWRSTSLNYSRLWATIAYDRSHVKISDEQVLAHLRTYLRRAAGHLLDVRFASLELYPKDIVQSMLELLLENSSTWHRILIFAPMDVCQSELLARFQEIRAPHLASYEFKFFNENGDRIPPQLEPSTPTFSLLGTPKLTHLSFQTVAFMSSIPCSPNITTIHVEHRELMYTWTTLLTLLRLPCLRTLSIVWNVFLRPSRGIIERIVAPELVQFRCSDEIVAEHIWFFLQAPKLDVLVLNAGRIPYFSSLESLPLILSLGDELETPTAPFPSLRTLVLLGCATNPFDSTDRVLRFLAHSTRSIINLCISNFLGHDSLRSIVKIDVEGVRMWPNLELLAVDVSPVYGLYLAPHLKSFIAHRSGALPRVFKLALPDSAAAAWRDEDAISWSAFVERGYYHQTLPAQVISDISHSFNPDGLFDESIDHFEAVSVAERWIYLS